MRVLVTGAGGMIGRKLVARLRDGALGPLDALVLHDVAAPDVADATTLGGDVGEDAAALAAHRPDVVFHLAAVVSSEAEADRPLGYRVNLDGTRALFEALAGSGARMVYASSAAVFGGPYPDSVPDDFAPRPLSSYGAQKLIGEVLLDDLARRGLLDGVSLRLPTICVRPGAPNRAASGFFSSIIREPLQGLPAVLPVPRDVVHTVASPRSAVGFLLHAAAMDTAPMGPRRAVTLPGVAVGVGEMIDALARAGGDPGLIEERPDPAIWAIVKTWPARFEARAARDLGFEAERDFDAVVRAHVEDELSP